MHTKAATSGSGGGRTATRAPICLLLITWNRREYVEKTLANLLADPADFRLYWWDNGSTDGAADVVASCRDPRIVARHRSPENVMQTIPTRWFLEVCTSEIIGKVDDDTLVPAGWLETLEPAVREHPRIGMLGCWTYWPEDFERHRRKALRKLVRVGEYQVLRDMAIGGTAFLMRRQTALRFQNSGHRGTAFPVDRLEMTCAGLISGWYYPLLWAEHMDDPRSEHCLMRRPGGMESQAALTARTRGMNSADEYLAWIVADVDNRMTTSVRRQVWRTRWERSRGYRLLNRIKARL